MKNKEKKMLLILVIVSILIITVIWFITRREKEETVNGNLEENKVVEEFVQVLEDGTKLNTSNKLSEMKQFQGLKIGNIQLTNRDNKTELIADVENPGTTDTKAMLVNIILYDKNRNEIATLGGRISPIKAGQTMQFSTTAMIDYANAYDFEFKLK